MLNGWKNVNVGDICKISTGSKNTQDNVENGKYPFFVRSDKVERINTYSYDGEAVLTAGDGVGVGKVVHYINGKFDFHQRVYKMSDFHGVDGKYFYYYFKKFFYNRVKLMSAKNSVDSVRLDMIRDMIICIPEKIDEQKAIADILTNVDNLINLIQNTIEKKKKIKDQAMMELFDIKNQKYKTITLNQIGYTYSGLSGMNSSNFTGGNKQYITFLNILNNPVVKEEFFGKFHCDNIQNKVQKGDLFFNTSSETPEEVAMCATIDYDVENVYLNSFCFGFRIIDKSVNNKYLTYFFRSQYGRNIMKTIAQGSTRFNLPKEKFLNYKIQIPEDINRQIEVTEILSNMDNEIEKLNIKLNKYKLIKEGMMEDLLTGKVRLNYE